MNTRLPLSTGFLVFLCFTLIQTHPCAGQLLSERSLTVLAKDEGSSAPREDLKPGSIRAVEEYEKEKLLKLKRNIGRRLMTVPTANPTLFYESPDELERTLSVKKEKEALVIKEVVQNRSGSMNFYQVKFDSGK